jgi:hypothetical protein
MFVTCSYLFNGFMYHEYKSTLHNMMEVTKSQTKVSLPWAILDKLYIASIMGNTCVNYTYMECSKASIFATHDMCESVCITKLHMWAMQWILVAYDACLSMSCTITAVVHYCDFITIQGYKSHLFTNTFCSSQHHIMHNVCQHPSIILKQFQNKETLIQ